MCKAEVAFFIARALINVSKNKLSYYIKNQKSEWNCE